MKKAGKKVLKAFRQIIASSILAASLFNAGCLEKRVETIRLEKNFVIPRDFGNKPEKISNANSILFDIPEKIPGAGEIEKYLIRDAECCLILIRQTHYKSEFSDENIKKEKDAGKRKRKNYQDSRRYIQDFVLFS